MGWKDRAVKVETPTKSSWRDRAVSIDNQPLSIQTQSTGVSKLAEGAVKAMRKIPVPFPTSKSDLIPALKLPMINPASNLVRKQANTVGKSVEGITGMSKWGGNVSEAMGKAGYPTTESAVVGTGVDMLVGGIPDVFTPESMAANVGMALLPEAAGIEKSVIHPMVKNIPKIAIEKLGDIAGKSAEKLISSSIKLKPSARRDISSNYVAGKTPEKWLLENDIKPGNPEFIMKQLDDMADKSKTSVDDILANKKGKYKIEQAKQALDELDELFENTRGNEDVLKEIKELKQKAMSEEKLNPFKSDYWNTGKEKGLNLTDLNRVKRLIDKHQKLFSKGEPKTGAKAAGLVNIRQKIQKFIESKAPEVKALNKRTQVSTEISNAIADRELTSANNNIFSLTDWITAAGAGAGAIAGGAPGSVLGATAVLVGKKILSSPTFKTRLAVTINRLPKSQIRILESSMKNGITAEGKNILNNVIQSATEKAAVALPTVKDNKKLGLPPLK